MHKPTSIKFDDVEYSIKDIYQTLGSRGPAPNVWIRVKFTIPEPYDAPRQIEEWLRANCPNAWRSYNYRDPRNKNDAYVMVVRFQDKNDALFFKLRGGHQAWEQSDKEY